MISKCCLILCAQIFLTKSISAYCANTAWPASYLAAENLGWAASGLGYESPILATAPCNAANPFLGHYDLAAFPTSSGGGFIVSSASPVPPYGVSVISENAIEGILAVGGQLPFLGTVGLEGALPTTGAGVISYGCGNGNVGMIREDIAPIAAGPVWPGTGLRYSSAAGPAIGYGCGCGSV